MVEISRIRSQPTEVRPRTDATPFGERLERPARLTVTEEDEMHSRPASRENGCRLEKRGVILHGRETRDDSDDDRVSRNTQLVQRGSLLLRAPRPERGLLDEVRNHGDASGRHALDVAQRAAHGRTVREHPMRQAKSHRVGDSVAAFRERMPPAPARDHHWRSRNTRPQCGEHVVVHVMAVDDVDAPS